MKNNFQFINIWGNLWLYNAKNKILNGAPSRCGIYIVRETGLYSSYHLIGKATIITCRIPSIIL